MKVFIRDSGKKTFLGKVDIDSYFDHVETELQIKCPGLWFPTPVKGICMCGDGSSKNAIGTACIKTNSPKDVIEKPSLVCEKFQFMCKSNDECIDHKYVCDGSDDCSDASDEEEAPDGPCPSRCDFKCDGSRCIEKHQVCDGSADCIDESDESVPQCHNADHDEYSISIDDHCEEFMCDNGNCVLYEQRCDLVDNCGDDTDEMDCPSLEMSTSKSFILPDDQDDPDPQKSDEDYEVDISDCKSPDYYCLKNRKCIPVHQLCDGISQCSDDSDELGRCSERLCDHFTECQFFCHNAPNPNGFVCYCPQHMVSLTLEIL